MRVNVFVRTKSIRPPHFVKDDQFRGDWGRRVCEGFMAHGITAQVVLDEEAWSDSDLNVVWGTRRADVLSDKARTLVIELGYLGDRRANLSMAFDGLNGRGVTPKPKNGRGCVWSDVMQPWVSDGEYCLLLGQTPGDVTISDCPDYFDFLRSIPSEVHGKPVVFRPHPGAMHVQTHHPRSRSASLPEALGRAACSIAWSSNSLVDSVMAGVPAIAHSRYSMTNMVGSSMAKIDRPDRTKWLEWIAHRQWSPSEVSSGAAWEYLKSAM